jgi:UDP-2,4-diacetamido-2,4,6-trideoxy-beta-L-altropyranose hydrolase
MKVVFRVDASVNIGTGHVMRCLTLATELSAKGANCEFLCREHPGNIIGHLHRKGFVVHVLPTGCQADRNLAHSSWLGETQAKDAETCIPIVAKLKPDWLVVDHYGIDSHWESTLLPYCRRILAIDDLADRQHSCRILLDQTFGRSADDYFMLIPGDCMLLCGSSFALLRPEFAMLRPESLRRRNQPSELKRLLVTLGGLDKDNVTLRVMRALERCNLPQCCELTIVMGLAPPWLAEVQQQAANMPWRTKVFVNAENMAQLMADSDLVISGAGGTSWERCCLGVPGIQLILAQNQEKIARVLSEVGAAYLLPYTNLESELENAIGEFTQDPRQLSRMSFAAAQVTDGRGVDRILQHICESDLT